MARRCVWLWLSLSILGCEALPTMEVSLANSAAVRLWAEGQTAMQNGDTDKAIDCYQQSLAGDPSFVQSHLGLAAAHLENGNADASCSHLAVYVAARPEHVVVRAYYAELLLRLHRIKAAREQFDRFEADIQDQGEAAISERIQCHSRLVKIAEALEDDYEEHLHRGIGLYLIALERTILPEPDGELSTEELLCKSAGELSLARLVRPEEARPCWYLYEVWSHLSQRQPALRRLRQASAAAPFSFLTPAEQRSLQLACQREEKSRN